jgi:alpha-glucoside transport system substrate-binding protein
MRRLRLIAVLGVLLVVAAACSANENNGGGGGGSASGGPTEPNTGKVNVLAAIDPKTEAAPMQKIFDDQINANADYTATIEASDTFEQDVQVRGQAGTLDVILLPQPGTLPGLVQTAHAVSLEDMGFDIGQLEATFGKPFMDLGVVNGEHYGLPTNINLKSMIWYPKDDFDKAGYKIPKTWDDLMALSDQIAKDGGTPWCVGFESGTATGWPATDWMEDIMLRTAGPDVYDQWWHHEIPFNDPSVVKAGQLFGDVMFHPGWVLGGASKTPSIAFGDAPLPMFDNPPGCWLHRQASFINAFFPTTAKSGVDYDWFPFPSIDPNVQGGPLFGGEMAMVFRNAPEVKDFLEKFMGTDVQCAMGGIQTASRISPNINVPSSCYWNDILKQSADVLKQGLQAGTARFDASDLMPTAVGSGSFWTGMVKYMQGGPDSLNGVLDDIEKSWPAS